MRVVALTDGPIAELGAGMYSTPFLHWSCFPTKRTLVTFEGGALFFDYTKQFEADFHEIHLIKDWDAVDLSRDWAVAFVDHGPDTRRVQEIARLRHAEYVVLHDAEGRRDAKYRFSTIYPLFKWRWVYDKALPHTAVLSNFHDLRRFHL